MVEYHILEVYHVFKHLLSKLNIIIFKMADINEIQFILIAILEADLRYNNNNNIVYNDTDDGVLTEDGFTYI